MNFEQKKYCCYLIDIMVCIIVIFCIIHLMLEGRSVRIGTKDLDNTVIVERKE